MENENETKEAAAVSGADETQTPSAEMPGDGMSASDANSQADLEAIDAAIAAGEEMPTDDDEEIDESEDSPEDDLRPVVSITTTPVRGEFDSAAYADLESRTGRFYDDLHWREEEGAQGKIARLCGRRIPAGQRNT